MNKAAAAAILEEIAILLELKGENPFKSRAYFTAARALEAMEGDLQTLVEQGGLEKIPGIGKALVEKITTLAITGGLKFHEDLKASIPPGLIEMLEIPGLGPKRVKALHEKLGIATLAELTAACEQGRVAALAGFGEKSQRKIIEGVRNRESYSRRHLWWVARRVADPILAGLRALPCVERAEHAGSLRRGLETVGDLDFIVGAVDPAPVMDWFTWMSDILEVTARGDTKASVRLAGGLQADLRVVPPDQFVFALHHFTGSKEHNVQMRQRALGRGYSLSEWGLSRKGKDVSASGDEPTPAAKLGGAVKNEEELFGFLGLRYIPPELREGLGEIEEAEKGPLQKLIEIEDIRGVFHNHTTATDGHNTLREMAAAAAALGWEYLGIADHSKASFQANGLSEEKLLAQVDDIRKLNTSGEAGVRIFAGVECDILPDGRLDFEESLLRRLDYVVVAVHSAFAQSEEEMTRRLIKAIEHPCATMLGHLTGRLLLMREGYKVNHAKVIDAAAANGVMIEINAHPRRLDMDWRYWRRAAEKGILACVNPDAHDTDGLDHFRAGVIIARKGWLTSANVLNTRGCSEVEKILAAKIGRQWPVGV